MTEKLLAVESLIRARPRTWLVTGAAGFIGSHLVDRLLRLEQMVVGFDNFATGREGNLASISSNLPASQWARFRFVEGDVRVLDNCRRVCSGVDVVLHHAALGSVPRSLDDPLLSHAVNVNGFINMLQAAREAKVSRFVYASSSSVYGDNSGLPKVEDTLGLPLSPYAATKLINETYARVFSRCYGLPTIGLRYFNVFGPRQDPNGAYAAVIPKWCASFISRQPGVIHGDGTTSRDFCYVDNVVQANLLAGTVSDGGALNCVYNIACGDRTSLRDLYEQIRSAMGTYLGDLSGLDPISRPERAGDVRHSLAAIRLARERLGYEPTIDVAQGIAKTCAWYADNMRQ